MNSFNHYSLGSVGEWLFRHVGGIELDPEVPGFDRFILKPWIRHGIEFARVSYRCLHGEILSHWERQGTTLRWEVVIPPNTRARLFIPSEPGTEVDTDSLGVVEHNGEFAVCDALAGRYIFTSTFQP